MRNSTYAIIGVVAVASWWLAAPGKRPLDSSPNSTPTPGYYFDNATVTETDATGHTILTLQTRHAEQDVDARAIRLQTIAVNYESAPDASWLLAADSGVMPIGSEILSLKGHVALQANSTRANGAVVHTEHMVLDRTHHTATSDELSRIEWPPHEVTARGFKLDLTRRTLTLENSVHGTFHR